MQLVIPKKNFSLNHGGYYWNFVQPPGYRADGSYSFNEEQVYVVPDDAWYQHKDMFVLPNVDREKIAWPPLWDMNAALDSPKKTIRVLIMHGVGSGYGDILSGAYALDRLRARFEREHKRLHICALVRETAMQGYYEVYRLRSTLDEIRPFAMTLHEVKSYDFMVDTEHLLREQPFSALNFYDYWLDKFGLDWKSEPKHASASPNPKVLEAVRAEVQAFRTPGDKFCVLNFHASKLRSIPRQLWTPLAEALAERYRVVLVANPHDATALREWMTEQPPALQARFVDATTLTCQGWDYLAGVLLHLADVLVTPDTGVLHLAGVLNVPTVAIFFTIEPDMRVRYFPNVRSYVAAAWRQGPYWGEHKLVGAENLQIMEQVERAKQNDEYLDLWRACDIKEVVRLADEVAGLPPRKPNIPAVIHPRHAHPRIAVFGQNPLVNHFGDRLPYLYLPMLLPADAVIDWYRWRPYPFVKFREYDLVIFGAGGNLFGPILEQPMLPEMLRCARRAIGLFGVEYPGTVNRAHMRAVLSALDVWFARTRQDIVEFALDRAQWAGDLSVLLFQPIEWDIDTTLEIVQQPLEPHACDHAMKEIPRHRRVISGHLHPLLCALAGAEEVEYGEKTHNGEPSRAFDRTLRDIFGKPCPPGKRIACSREKFLAYKLAVAEAAAQLSAKVKELLA